MERQSMETWAMVDDPNGLVNFYETRLQAALNRERAQRWRDILPLGMLKMKLPKPQAISNFRPKGD